MDTTPEPAGRALSARRAEIESWFLQRGVPQLIDDYSTERRMDDRAAPYLTIWLVAGTILWWGTRPDRSVSFNILAIVGTLAVASVGLAVFRWLRRRVMWWVDRRLDVADVLVVGVLIGAASAVVERSWPAGLADAGRALLGIGAVYLYVGLGLGAIGMWSVRRLRQEVRHLTGLLARTLPVLLILVLFLLFAAEMWEAAHYMDRTELSVVVTLMAGVAALLVLTSFRPELRAAESADWAVMRQRAEGTPAASLGPDPERSPRRLRTLQRLNLGTLVLIGQLIQSAFVAVQVSVFLVVFGLFIFPAGLQQSWVGEPITIIASLDLLGGTRVLSREAITMSILMGSVVALYFTGLAVTDSAYRTAHFDRILDEMRQLVAARAVYLSAVVEPEEGAGGGDPTA